MSVQPRDFRGVVRPVSVVIMGVAVAMGLCAVIGALWDALAPDSSRPLGPMGPFDMRPGASIALSSAIVLGLGAALYMYGRRHVTERITRREALLSVSLIWVAAGLGGAVPFMLTVGMSPPDAIFESISGLTTTGATVITEIEATIPRPLLLWRSLIQWLGGMGIVVLFVAVFPNLGAGGKHLFRGEVPGASPEGLRPRIAETSFALWRLYAALTFVQIVLLKALGVNLFDAVNHSFTTMSTGGFSTYDASIAAFESPAIEYVIAIFMLIASVNYALYYAVQRTNNWKVFVRNIEFKAYVTVVLLSVAVMTLVNVELHGGFADSLRNSVFMVATTISSTGYGTHGYSSYEPVALTVMILLMFIGGCSGSTAGGLKIERGVLMNKLTLAQIRRNYRPATIQLVRMGRTAVSSQVLADVAAFFMIYLGTLAAGMLFVSLVENASVPTAFGAMVTCLSNMGPAPFHEVADNFAGYGGLSKLFFSFAMLLGRLEFFTLLTLLLPGFWRR